LTTTKRGGYIGERPYTGSSMSAPPSKRRQSWRSVAWNAAESASTERIRALLAAEYPAEDVATLEYCEWLLRRNPCGDAIIRLAVDEDGTVAGQYVVIPVQLTIDGVVHDGALSLLTLVDERYRGQGVFTTLARDVIADCAARGRRFIIGFPNQSSYPGFTRALGFRDIGSVPLLLRPLKPSRLLQAKLGPALGTVLRPLIAPADLYYRPATRQFPQIAKVDEFGAAFDALDAVLAQRFRVHQPRSARFLAWRFAQSPRGYATYAWYDAGRVRGYVVLRRTVVSRLVSGMLVDFFVDDGADALTVGSELVRFALGELSRMGAHLAGALVNRGTTEHAALAANGFFVCPARLAPQPFPVIFRATTPGWDAGKPVASLAGWALAMGDYDAV
jgi:GNAT superfamily N-acetyltransferase